MRTEIIRIAYKNFN